jgi:hypothetical protein
MKRFLTPFVLALACSGSAAAQASEPLSPFELRGSGGWIGFPDDSMIHHGLVGASLRISAGRLGIEPEVTYMVGPGNDRDVVVAPVVSWEFGKGKVRPYVLGAAGMLFHSEGGSWGMEYHLSGGLGMRTQISRRWSVSPNSV